MGCGDDIIITLILITDSRGATASVANSLGTADALEQGRVGLVDGVYYHHMRFIGCLYVFPPSTAPPLIPPCSPYCLPTLILLSHLY